MKASLLIVLMIVSAKAMSMDRNTADQLLQAQGMNLSHLEASGATLLLGEVTGGGRAIPADRVQAIILDNQAITRTQISSMDFRPATNRLSDIDSFRAGGTYFTREDIRGVVVK